MGTRYFYNKGLVSISGVGIDSSDSLQYLIGTNWELANGELQQRSETADQIAEIYYSDPEFDTTEMFSSATQTVKIIGDSNSFANQEEWQSWIRTNLTLDTTIDNHYFSLLVPDQDVNPIDFNVGSFDSKLVYNYEFFDYENLTKNIVNNGMPNYFIGDYHSEYANDYTTEFLNLGYSDLNGLNPAEKFGDATTQINSPEAMFNAFDEGEEVKELNYNYFNVYTNLFKNETPNILNTYAQKNSNIFLLYETDPSKTDMLPNYVQMNFPQYSSDTGFDLSYWSIGLDQILDSTNSHKNLFKYLKRNSPDSTSFYFTDSSGYSNDEIKIHDIASWFSSESISGDSVDMDDELFLDTYDNPSIWEKFMRMIVLKGGIKSRVQEKLRTFSLLVNYSFPAHREIIGYKIEKYVDTIAGSPLQTYYVAANESSPFTFIDSQLKYDQRYVYQVTSLVAVLGTSYKYKNLYYTSDDRTGLKSAEGDTTLVGELEDGLYETYRAEITFESRPSLKIFEIPLATFTERLLEPPILPPNVNFFNESGKNKKVKIFLNDNFTSILKEDELVPYEVLTEEDAEYLEKLKESQHLEEAFCYSSKAAAGIFEVYRTDVKPKSFSDFNGAFVGAVQNDFTQMNAANGSSAEFIDTITTHKKYYYLFRAVSHHGNKSNPTSIYEVEIVEDSDETYLITNAFDFEEVEVFSPSKNMRVFMQIVPNLEQILIDNSEFESDTSTAYNHETNFPTYISPGLEESIWDFDKLQGSGQRFKIRLTSKHTGKKIDLNIAFKMKKKGE